MHFVFNIRITNCWFLSIGSQGAGEKTNNKYRQSVHPYGTDSTLLYLLSFPELSHFISWSFLLGLSTHPSPNMCLPSYRSNHTLKPGRVAGRAIKEGITQLGRSEVTCNKLGFSPLPSCPPLFNSTVWLFYACDRHKPKYS